MEAAEETKIQTGADAKVVVTQGLLVAWVMAAFKAGAVGHATVARTKFSELSERLRRLEDDAEFIRDSAAKRIMEAEQKAKAVGTAAAADAATERAAREQELVAAHSRAQTLEDQLKQARVGTCTCVRVRARVHVCVCVCLRCEWVMAPRTCCV